jgi:rubrerythrin
MYFRRLMMTRQEQIISCLANIRELMRAELESINQYQSHIEESDISELNEIWQYIMENEKRHYGMLLEVLRKLDLEQAAQYANVKAIDITMPTKIQLSPPIVKKGRLEILNNVRNDMCQELKTINEYEILIMKSPVLPIMQMINTINQDEKEHLEQLTKVILELDTDHYGSLV